MMYIKRKMRHAFKHGAFLTAIDNRPLLDALFCQHGRCRIDTCSEFLIERV